MVDIVAELQLWSDLVTQLRINQGAHLYILQFQKDTNDSLRSAWSSGRLWKNRGSKLWISGSLQWSSSCEKGTECSSWAIAMEQERHQLSLLNDNPRSIQTNFGGGAFSIDIFTRGRVLTLAEKWYQNFSESLGYDGCGTWCGSWSRNQNEADLWTSRRTEEPQNFLSELVTQLLSGRASVGAWASSCIHLKSRDLVRWTKILTHQRCFLKSKEMGPMQSLLPLMCLASREISQRFLSAQRRIRCHVKTNVTKNLEGENR